MAGRVTVYGSNILRAPLCDDADATTVVIRDSEDRPILILARLSGDTWGLANPDDEDWDAICVRFGLAPGPSLDEVMRRASC